MSSPKETKRKAESNDSDSEDVEPPPKRVEKENTPEKKKEVAKESPISSPARAADAKTKFPLEGSKKVSISVFKGKTYVDIREWYVKDGQELPGKKGISLTVAGFEALLKHSPEVLEIAKQAH